MKVLFLCPSLAPGRSGVGDYTRRLAGECVRQGHASVLLALHDSAVSVPAEEVQVADDSSLPALRLPARLPWRERWACASRWCNAAGPDAISLQFVCFGFESKGLIPNNFGRKVRALAGKRRVQVMFHELWLGLPRSSSLKHRTWGLFQRKRIRTMLRQLQAAVAHTQASPYLHILQQNGWQADRLPLFSNVPVSPLGPDESGLGDACAQAGIPLRNREGIWLVGVFGTLHPEWQPAPLAAAFAAAGARAGRTVSFLLLGRHGRTNGEVARWNASMSAIPWIDLGPRDPEQLSRFLQCLDFGAVSTPLSLLEKSGSAACLLEHGLPLVVCRNDCHFGPEVPIPPRSASHFHVLDEDLEGWLARASSRSPFSRLPEVAEAFLRAFAAAKAA